LAARFGVDHRLTVIVALAHPKSAAGIAKAFVAARLLAVREWQRLRALASAGSNEASVNWQVIDTEFGYDLKRDSLVVSRFWIHARAVTQA